MVEFLGTISGVNIFANDVYARGDLDVTGSGVVKKKLYLPLIDEINVTSSGSFQTFDSLLVTPRMIVECGSQDEGLALSRTAQAQISAPEIHFFRQNGTFSSPAPVEATDWTGAIWAYGYDNSRFQGGSAIVFDVAEDVTVGNIKGRTKFLNMTTGDVFPKLHMTLDEEGNLILETNANPFISPAASAKLTVQGTISGTDTFVTNLTSAGDVSAATGQFADSLTVSGVPVDITGGGGGGGVSDINAETGSITLDGSDGNTAITSPSTITIQGFRPEFVNASGSLQSQIDNLDSIYATDAELTSVSGHLSTEIDTDIATHAADSSAHHTRYADAEAITALEPTTSALAASGVATDAAVAANTTLITTTSGHLQSQIDSLDSTYATDAELTSVSGHLQTQIDGIDSSVTLQDAYDNGDGTIVSTSGKPLDSTFVASVSGSFTDVRGGDSKDSDLNLRAYPDNYRFDNSYSGRILMHAPLRWQDDIDEVFNNFNGTFIRIEGSINTSSGTLPTASLGSAFQFNPIFTYSSANLGATLPTFWAAPTIQKTSSTSDNSAAWASFVSGLTYQSSFSDAPGSTNAIYGYAMGNNVQQTGAALTVEKYYGFATHPQLFAGFVLSATIEDYRHFSAGTFTNIGTLNTHAGFVSELVSGTNVWAFRDIGGAPSSFAGDVKIGSSSAPNETLDVEGNITVDGNITTSGTTGNMTIGGTVINFANLPTSSGSLNSGDLWVDVAADYTLKVTP